MEVPQTWLSSRFQIATIRGQFALAGTIAVSEGGPNFADGALWLSEGSQTFKLIKLGGPDDLSYPDSVLAMTANDTGLLLGVRLCEPGTQNFSTLDQVVPEACVDAFVAQYEWDGSRTWQFTLGGSGKGQQTTSVALGADGTAFADGVYAAGALAGGAPLGPFDVQGYFVARLRHGQLEWVRTFDGVNGGPESPSPPTAASSPRTSFREQRSRVERRTVHTPLFADRRPPVGGHRPQ